jgi:hypothetical protein
MRDRKDAKFFEEKIKRRNIFKFVILSLKAKELNLPLYIAFLDSQKAFDVVDHQSLKCKLFYNGINGKIWSLMDAWYFNLSSIDVPLVKPNCNDDCCDGSRCSIRFSIRDRPFNLKGGVWFFVSFRIFYSNNTRVSI